MKYENSRQATLYLERLLQDLDSAAQHPFVSNLPDVVRNALLDPDSSLRKLLPMRQPTTSYMRGPATGIEELDVRVGPNAKSRSLSASDVSTLASLVSATPVSTQHIAQLQAAVTSGKSPDVKCVRWVLLHGRNAHSGKLWADTDRKSECKVFYCYTLDAPLPHDSKHFEGLVVQLEHLFLVGDTPYAYVTYGKRYGEDTGTGCRKYTFSEADQSARRPRIVLAKRLCSYVHFGLVRGELILNRFYIPN
jgi:hypothetical protein